MCDKPKKKLYRDGLDDKTRERYLEKMTLIGGIDPYEVTKSQLNIDVKCLPAISYIDIINYLVNTKSAYSMDDLKAYKSLEAYNQFVCGWVRDVMTMNVENRVLVTARVRHSQRMNDTALKPWVITGSSGIVEAAHCDCMAGLGEACSHVGALLFYVEAASRINASKTVTQEKAYWLLPNSVDKVPYSEVSDIDFMSADTKKRRLDSTINGDTNYLARSTLKLPKIPEPTTAEKEAMLESLFKSQSKASVLTVSAKYQEHFLPKILQDGQLPEPLLNLKNEKYFEIGSVELREECKKLYELMNVTKEQCTNVEIMTREQAKCKVWHQLRMGRITASNMKAVCATSLENPAISTIQAICGITKFKNNATIYGCRHEQDALSSYTNLMKSQHENFSITPCGLFINPDYPHIGATPDALVTCSCCGDGVVEVKCPYCAKDKLLSETKLDYMESGKLKVSHRYSYQIQTQLIVTGREFCDFVVWTSQDVSVQRIEPNVRMECEILEKSKKFFIHVILPEITGNLQTRERFQKQKMLSKSMQNSDNVQTDMPQKQLKIGNGKNVKLDNIVTCSTQQSSKKTSKAKQISKNVQTDKTHNQLKIDNGKKLKLDNILLCVCKNVCSLDTDNVVQCDSENCRYVFLHYACVNLKRKPKSPYYCPECRKSLW